MTLLAVRQVKLNYHLTYDKQYNRIMMEVEDYEYAVGKRKTGPYVFVMVGIS